MSSDNTDTRTATSADSQLEAVIPLLKKAADEGNPEAQYRLGLLYANGEGVELDYVEAAFWFDESARQDLTDAQRALAWLYANGYGVDQDNQQARHWYVQAAESGDPDAQCLVGHMYLVGRFDAPIDIQSAMLWFEQAAAQNHATAQYMLGKLFAGGESVAQNDEAAFQWLTLAIMNGSEKAKSELAQLTSRLDDATMQGFKQRMFQAMQPE